MYKTHARTKHSKIDLQDDLVQIKKILAQTAWDVNGKAKEVLVDSYDTVKDKTTDLKDGVEAYVQKKPLSALWISFLVGTVFGFLTFRKK